jgi:ribonucleoside-triphosphate reductase
MNRAKNSLEKRGSHREQPERGLYLIRDYLKDVKERTGFYWYNHFNTILSRMSEACKTAREDKD